MINCQAAGTNWFSKRGINKDGTECISDERATFHRCIGGTCKVNGANLFDLDTYALSSNGSLGEPVQMYSVAFAARTHKERVQIKTQTKYKIANLAVYVNMGV